MRLPHWLRCHFSRWTTFERTYGRSGYHHGYEAGWFEADDVSVCQWRECLTCGERRERLVRRGPLGNAVPRGPSVRS